MTLVDIRESDFDLVVPEMYRSHATDELRLRVTGLPARPKSTRSAIMAAARAAFASNGIQGTRLAAVARAAWVAPSTVSMHFKGKEALFTACLDEEIDWLFEGTFARVGSHPYPLLSGDTMRILARRLHRYPLLSMSLAASPSYWGKRYYTSTHLNTMRLVMLKDIVRAQGEGLIRPGIDPERSAQAMAEIQSWSLWTAALEPGNFSHIEQVIETTKATVLPSAKLHALHEECRFWRTAASQSHRSQSTTPVATRPTGNVHPEGRLRTL